LLGRTRAVYLLATLLSLAYITVFLLIIYHILPYSALIVFLATPLAGRLILSYRKNAQRSEEIKGMARAAKHHWVFGLLLVFVMWHIGLIMALEVYFQCEYLYAVSLENHFAFRRRC